ncbi:Grx4 family monothiol glutaredoxin [Stutzerimonas tarimensis]|uniref:Glutaredoxin n=1 Tax=Stutzerimonas tarimensis TaxID=1507735 RepID=A0ABV7T6V5_9GAMM
MQVLDTAARINQQIAENPVILYMKGTPEAPECGFSRQVVETLKQIGQPYAFVNVLAAPHIREKLPQISQWPTFPQLFVKGELVGGCDIVLGLHSEGSLKELLESANAA